MSAKVNVPPDCVVQKTKNPDVVNQSETHLLRNFLHQIRHYYFDRPSKRVSHNHSLLPKSSG